MLLARRRLLAAVPALALPPVPMPRDSHPVQARLRPDSAGPVSLTPWPQDRMAFEGDGVAGAVIVPATRARLVAILPLGDREVAVLAFAADSPENQIDLFAVAIWDGGGLRLGALDVLSWRAADGAHLGTRLNAASDGRLLSLDRTAAAPRTRTHWQRESWIDRLSWRDSCVLADAPARAPLAGTWQHMLAAWRLDVIAQLNHGCHDATAVLDAQGPPPAVWHLPPIP